MSCYTVGEGDRGPGSILREAIKRKIVLLLFLSDNKDGNGDSKEVNDDNVDDYKNGNENNDADYDNNNDNINHKDNDSNNNDDGKDNEDIFFPVSL